LEKNQQKQDNNILLLKKMKLLVKNNSMTAYRCLKITQDIFSSKHFIK